ncbi:hypothetical protein Sango_1328500 [Sesamum angolense]|uniref:RNI-like superfamily protein n=1 Tax=Sesamum angolense TaxID=2727404 RepID=A0AAE1WS66_9LAMI|nr:hypothetical protein Sango_1328500 [Sesamum angolense]
MEKGTARESTQTLTSSLRNLQLKDDTVKSKSTQNSIASSLRSQFLSSSKGKKPPSLLSLCLGVVGSNIEDIIDDLAEIALAFPPDVKLVLVAIARRRKLLNDDIVIALADSSWEILDISGSDVSDCGICHIVNICQNLRVVDISRCSKLTLTGVSKLLQLCHSLEILRWGGCPRSDYTARRCLGLLKPNLNDGEGESWEELDAAELTHGAESLRWLVWPKIDKDSQETLTIECPRIIVNPKPSLLGFRGNEAPQEALSQFVLDDPIVKDIDPKTWVVSGFTASRSALLPVTTPNELSMAEKFRLAFLERDTRLAPKRAKNARQHQRRAEREWMMMDARAKALALASKATKSVNLRNF